MPHVDELLGITTLASMGLLVAVSLQPVHGVGSLAASTDRSAVAATKSAGSSTIPSRASNPAAKERT